MDTSYEKAFKNTINVLVPQGLEMYKPCWKMTLQIPYLYSNILWFSDVYRPYYNLFYYEGYKDVKEHS